MERPPNSLADSCSKLKIFKIAVKFLMLATIMTAFIVIFFKMPGKVFCSHDYTYFKTFQLLISDVVFKTILFEAMDEVLSNSLLDEFLDVSFYIFY